MDRHQGMADAGRDEVAGMVLPAWDAFIARAATVDLERPSRLPGWRAQEICVHLGCWDDHTAMADLIASARAGGTGTPPEVDAVNARVIAAHRNASRAEVLAALERNRDATANYLAKEPVELDTAPTVSVVGQIPLLSVVLGQAYELAVHGLDLVSCGAAPPPTEALQSGLAALADVTAGLAASMDITGGVTLATPDGGWGFTAGPEGWWVRRVPAGSFAGPAVEASADLLLEAASGRINPVPAVARRRLRVHDVGGLLTLAPIVQAVPGIPGGPILQLAARTVGGAGGVLGRLFGRG
ncbi:maleylpyruvate isomerase N-terminal domain-containing protein [Blastococcus sp. PRF04-17]|uniref:maleylpyruvate isomerase N-terminal domain-containing protein n=1 Tax=Blastococcus sp. PRF04-17 TaxID=2933797 RepID=UPI001FF6D160|nr:maleylpyruvate isomerase N-terminal domain-containing protein [Blastococcus sp. PRF04-17]UOY03126.1 maleylpyruvate isomerase N-terminal domain-containing protein [Blastococcus sp. PRF04-17]